MMPCYPSIWSPHSPRSSGGGLRTTGSIPSIRRGQPHQPVIVEVAVAVRTVTTNACLWLIQLTHQHSELYHTSHTSGLVGAANLSMFVHDYQTQCVNVFIIPYDW